jgi:hypothetical protein
MRVDGVDKRPTSSVEQKRNIDREIGDNREVDDKGYSFSLDRLGRNFIDTNDTSTRGKILEQLSLGKNIIL